MDKPVKYVNTSEVMNTFERFFQEVREGGKESYDFRRVEEMRQALAGILDRTPAAEVEPVVYAHWDEITGTEEDFLKSEMCRVWKCSNCGALLGHPLHGSPNDSFRRCDKCGAHMGKAADNGKVHSSV